MSTLFHHGLFRLELIFAGAAPSAASALLSSVWRGLLLALAVALVLGFFPRLSAAVRSAIWMCVLVALLALPVASFVFPTRAVASAPGAFQIDPRWSYALVAIWITVSLARLLQLAASAVQLRRLAMRSVPLSGSEAVQRVLAGSARRAQLCASADIDRPSVVGFFRPRILLPIDLLGTISESDLAQIVTHELEHLRRRDDWTNLLQKLSLALLPLHPVVFWLDRRLCFERELACDDGVLRATQARKSYAACLTNLAEQSLLRRGLSLALGALGTWKPRSEVAKRVYRILAAPQDSMNPLQSRIVAGVLATGVVAGALALSSTPLLISFTPKGEAISNTSKTAAWVDTANVLAMNAPARVATGSIAPPHATLTRTAAAPRASSAMLHLGSRRAAMKPLEQHRTAKTPQTPSEPMYRLASWQADELPMARFAVAIQQDSQFTYAAVPVRGGWLVFQL